VHGGGSCLTKICCSYSLYFLSLPALNLTISLCIETRKLYVSESGCEMKRNLSLYLFSAQRIGGRDEKYLEGRRTWRSARACGLSRTHR